MNSNADPVRAELLAIAREMKMRSLDGATRSALLYSDDLRVYADRLRALASAPPSAPVGVEALLQAAMNELRPPEKMTEARAEYWKAGARAAIRAMNAALSQQPAAPSGEAVELYPQEFGRAQRVVPGFEEWWRENRRPGWAGNPAAKRAAEAAWVAAIAAPQQPAAVDEAFIARLADALIARDWDVDPDCDGSGIVQLREAVIAAQQQGGAA